MYVELVTRIALQPFKAKEGLLREAFTSLYAVIAETRGILKRYGSSIARPAKRGSISFAEVAVAVVNEVLRPYLTKWHPALLAHESACPHGVNALAHEIAWADYAVACADLGVVQKRLAAYAENLADACGVRLDRLSR